MTPTPDIHPDEAACLRCLNHLLQLRAAGTRWPPHVYEVLLKVLAHASWEPIPVRRVNGVLQFLYSRRDPHDLGYPPDPVKGPPACFAGTNNRGESLATGLARVSQEDFRQQGQLTNPRFAGCVNWFRETRGPDVGLAFFCDYVGEPPPGAEWRDWDDPPVHMVESHRILARRVIQAVRDGEQCPWFLDDPR